MKNKRIVTLAMLIFFTLTSAFFSSHVQAIDLDPGGGNGIEVNTTFRAYVRDTQSSTAMQGISVRLELGSTVLQTGTTNSLGYFYFNTVTDGGNTDYHIIMQTTKADPKYIDMKVTSSGVAGTYLTTVQFDLNIINKWAVLVGLGDWSDSRFGDTTGHKDANDWYTRLSALSFNHIATLGDNTHTYTDPNKILATKANIKAAIENVAENADNNDVVVFTFATHNTIAGLACWDSGYYNVFSYFKGDWFGNKVDACKASRILVWFHSCKAESFIQWATGTSVDSNTLWMGSSKATQLSFNDNFRADFWQHTDLLGGLGTASLEAIFNSLSTEYPKTTVIDGNTCTMEPVMYDGSTSASFYLYG